MPNGVMTGDGSKADPYIIMDAYDFNELRNITSSASSYKYFELGADIDLSVYPGFTPIPNKYFNIDGKGHTISEINIIITQSTTYTGLFGRLYSNEYIKNFTIEGTISMIYGGTADSVYCGALCGQLFLYADAVVSNIEAYFSLTFSAPTYPYMGGLIGLLQVSESRDKYITGCAFKGSIELSMNDASSTTIRIGGLIAMIWSGSNSPDNWITIERCQTCIEYTINSNKVIRLGGILAEMTGVNNNDFSSSRFKLMIKECTAESTIQFTHTNDLTANGHRIGGIACYPGMQSNQITTLEKCVAFIDVLWTHQYLLYSFRMAGLLYIGASSSQVFIINQGYAVMRIINPDGLPWTGITESLGSVTYLPSTMPSVVVNNAFFDKEVFAEYYNGTFTEAHGVTTAEFKSADFLRLKGWDVDE